METQKKSKLPDINDVNFRSFSALDMKTLSKDNCIEGHPAIYDQRANIGGWFYEVIERGAFDETDFDDVLFCVNHGTHKIPLARSRRNNGNSTMQLILDDQGLFVRAELDVENNVEAKALYGSVSRGDIDGMSFIFYVKEEHWENLDSEMPTRRIKKIKRVREVSAVNLPAYEGTDINARDALDNVKSTLDNARANYQPELDNSNIEMLRLKSQILAKG